MDSQDSQKCNIQNPVFSGGEKARERKLKKESTNEKNSIKIPKIKNKMQLAKSQIPKFHISNQPLEDFPTFRMSGHEGRDGK